MKGRLLRGIAANGYGQMVTVGGQLVSVPVLIRAWGTEHYGAWVLLTAVPAALAFADGGLAVAGGNAMTMAVGRGDRALAGDLYRAILRTVTKALWVAAALALVLIVVAPPSALAWAVPGSADASRVVMGTLAAVTLVGTFSTVPCAALRADGQYATSVAATTSIRLAETFAILGAAVAGGSLEASALAWLTARVAGAAWLAAAARRRLAWISAPARYPMAHDDPARSLPGGGEPRSALMPRRPLSLESGHPRPSLGRRFVAMVAPRRAGSPTFDALRAPALASLAMPAAFAIGLQGVTIAVGLALSPDAVALFAGTRTLARAGVQLSGLVNHALMPEVARLHGREDHLAMRAMARLNTLSSVLLLGLGWAGTVLFGASVMTAWTGGRLQPDAKLIALVATATALHGLWLGRGNLLLAVNRQGEFAWLFLVVSLAMAALAAPVAMFIGLHGVAALMLAGEAIMVIRLWFPAWRAAASSHLLGGAPS